MYAGNYTVTLCVVKPKQYQYRQKKNNNNTHVDNEGDVIRLREGERETN